MTSDVGPKATSPDAAPSERIDWAAVASDLDSEGWSLVPALLTDQACDSLAGLYDDPDRFRSKVVMSRHGFGRGEYQYFRYPLPALVATLRTSFYEPLARIANAWNARLGIAERFPSSHEDFLQRCHSDGQVRPTPLLLNYSEGDFNCLHQDVYGEHAFPLQMATLLSAPQEDFTGGEFVMTEQRPRMQSRALVVPLCKGDAVIFAGGTRPVAGSRGDYRVVMRHGVSRIRSGRRRTLGIIFHDAA